MESDFEQEDTIVSNLGGVDFIGLCSMIGRRDLRLFHFTDVRNLESIFQHGIIPRTHPQFKELQVHRLDKSRLDNNGTCLSVGFPNYRMLWSKRIQENSFAILELDTLCLLSGNWLAFPTNSATFNHADSRQFAGLQALERVFEDNVPTTRGVLASRDNLGITKGWSTDPQAEVVVNERIDPKFIIEVHFDQPLNKLNALRIFTSPKPVPFRVSPELFAGRADAIFWKANRVITTVQSET